MIRLSPLISKVIVVSAFLAAGVFITQSVVRIPKMTGLAHSSSNLGAFTEGSSKRNVDASRPAEVGNPVAEDFSRKIERPLVVPPRGLIHIEDETFSAAYDEIYDHRSEYYGREIELAGIVLSQAGLSAGEFLIGRKLLWCCENDMYFIGFLGVSESSAPKERDKIRVRGTLEPRDYRDPETGKRFTVPAVRIHRIFPEPDLSERVYPSLSF